MARGSCSERIVRVDGKGEKVLDSNTTTEILKTIKYDDVPRLSVLISAGIVHVNSFVRDKTMLLHALERDARNIRRFLLSVGSDPTLGLSNPQTRVRRLGNSLLEFSALYRGLLNPKTPEVIHELTELPLPQPTKVDIAALIITEAPEQTAETVIAALIPPETITAPWLKTILLNVLNQIVHNHTGIHHVRRVWQTHRINWFFRFAQKHGITPHQILQGSETEILTTATTAQAIYFIETILQWGGENFETSPNTQKAITKAFHKALRHTRDGQSGAEYLLSRYPALAHTEEQSGDYGYSTLYLACGGDIRMAPALIAAGVTPHGYGPPLRNLILTARNHPVDQALHATRSLLSAGADPNAATPNGNTILYQALKTNCQVEVVRELLHAGADVNAPNLDGDPTAFALLSYAYRDEILQEFIHKGLDLNSVNSDGNPLILQYVVWELDQRMVFQRLDRGLLRALIKNGADPHQPNWYGQTAIGYIQRKYDMKATEMLELIHAILNPTYP